MVWKLEEIKDGGGSVRVGTVGTIGSLMTRELKSSSSASYVASSSQHEPISGSLGYKPRKPRKSMDHSCGRGMTINTCKHRNPEAVQRLRGQNQHRIPVTSSLTPKRQKPKAPLENVGNSPASKGANRSDFFRKTRNHKGSHLIPILGAENIHLEKSPIREKPFRKISNIVDIVDINCGSPGGLLSNKLKKIGFSKLSHSFI